MSEAFRERDHREGEDLSEQELGRGNAGDVHLEDRLLLALLGHGQRRQERREHGETQDEDPRPVELLRGEPGVVPEPDRGLDRAGLLRARRAEVVGSRDAGGIAGGEPGGVRVRRVDQELDGRLDAPGDVPAEVSRDDQHRARGARGERLLGRPVHRPGHEPEGDRGAEGVEKLARRRRASRSCTTTGRFATRKDRARAQQQQQDHRQDEGERERPPVADDLGQLLAGLGRDASHGGPSAPGGRLPARAGLLDDRDEDVLQREARLAGIDHADALAPRARV